MTKQKTSVSRRRFLLKGLAVTSIIPLGKQSFTAAAPASSSDAIADPNSNIAKLKWFTPAEYAFLTAAVAHLIPDDELGPGAVAAKVPEFIDKQMLTPYATGANWYMQGPFFADADPAFRHQSPLVPQQIYRLGIADINLWCEKQYAKSYSQLTEQQQVNLLSALEKGEIELNHIPAKVFFSLLLQNTREGFFSDPRHGGNHGLVGWSLIGFPGARADFMDWVERGEHYPYKAVAIDGTRES